MDDLTEEELKEFKPIPGYKFFMVSADGRVYRVAHRSGYRDLPGRLRDFKGDKLTLRQDNEARSWKVGDLIKLAFGQSHIEVPVHLIGLTQSIVEAHSAGQEEELEEAIDHLSQVLHKEKLWKWTTS